MSELIPFISTADLEAILGEALPDPNDLIVAIALDSACQTVRTYLGQAINLVENDVEIHSGTGRKKIRLRERPVRSVSEVQVDGAVIPATSYSVRDHVITALDGWWDHGNDNVRVTYTHGWDVAESSSMNVPADIRFVALNVARRVYSDVGSDVMSGALISESIGDYTYQLSDTAVSAVSSATQLTTGEKFVLDPYRIELVGDSPTQWV